MGFATSNRRLNKQELATIAMVENAMKVFADENTILTEREEDNVVLVFNLQAIYTRLTIQFCSQFEAFRNEPCSTRLEILKQFVFELTGIRFAFNYDPKKDGFKLISVCTLCLCCCFVMALFCRMIVSPRLYSSSCPIATK